jgi:UDP-glucose 4-epimerase
LVTGGQGLIGGSVARRLALSGFEVTATRRVRVSGVEDAGEVSPGAQRADAPIGWIDVDLARADQLAHLERFDAIVHTAAVLPQTHEHSDEVGAANRAIDETVFSAAESWRSRVVFISSVAVYGPRDSSAAAADESDRPQPVGSYAKEKVWAEEQGRLRSDGVGAPFTALRVCAPYGPGQRTMNVLKIFVERAARGEPLRFWGSGARRQDFVHTDDVARACEAALGHAGGTFNVASGATVTMRELAEIVAREGGLPPSAVQPAGKPDPGEEIGAAYRIERARGLLGWEPTVSLQHGVAEWIGRVRATQAP